jgi:hypothetical protein
MWSDEISSSERSMSEWTSFLIGAIRDSPFEEEEEDEEEDGS